MHTASGRERWLRIATTASVATAATLVLAKFAAWLATGSVSVLASLVDSLMDVAASFVNLLAVRYALRPPDAEHRFGHGKAEALAGLAQATFISGSALFLIFHAIDRLRHPQPLQGTTIGVGVMVFAIVATLVLLAIQRYAIRRTDSTAIRADALHYLSDLLTNAAVIVALLLSTLGLGAIDPVFAIGIAVYILYSAYRIARDALDLLMDRELPDEERERVLAIVRHHAHTHGVHDLRTRQSGGTRFVQLHLELDEDLPLREAHAIADQIEAGIRAELPDADVIIHQDPIPRRTSQARGHSA